jgi:hypothetical protein
MLIPDFVRLVIWHRVDLIMAACYYGLPILPFTSFIAISIAAPLVVNYDQRFGEYTRRFFACGGSEGPRTIMNRSVWLPLTASGKMRHC